MLPFEDIQRYLHGAWRVMNGRPDGLKMLDISADGFWDSFSAILIAFPPMIVGWVAVADSVGELDATFGDRFSVIIRLAVVDLGAWVVPLGALALVVRRAGIADRYVHFVVASNWSSALIEWFMLPPSIVRLLAPDEREFATILSLAVFFFALVFTWRMTNVSLGKGAASATALFTAMVLASLLVLFGLEWLFGLT